MRFGFIGLGAMGLRMANNIGTKKRPIDSLFAFDIIPGRAASINGANPCESIKHVVDQADIIVTMLPEGAHVSKVYQEILNTKPSNEKCFIDSSTVDLATSRFVAEKISSAGHRFVDAPVSGGTSGAEKGTLTFMIGAPTVDEQLTSVLSLMGKRLFPCGQQSAGLAAKLANNYILALNNLSTSEGFRIALSQGLNMKVFSDIVNASSGQSWSTTVNNPVPGVDENAPSSRDYQPGFTVNLCKKDLGLAVEASKESKLELPFGKHAPTVYQQLADAGLGNCDMSVFYKALGK